jgi:hypothetical protein
MFSSLSKEKKSKRKPLIPSKEGIKKDEKHKIIQSK